MFVVVEKKIQNKQLFLLYINKSCFCCFLVDILITEVLEIQLRIKISDTRVE